MNLCNGPISADVITQNELPLLTSIEPMVNLQFNSGRTQAVYKNGDGVIKKSHTVTHSLIYADDDTRTILGLTFHPQDLPLQVHLLCNQQKEFLDVKSVYTERIDNKDTQIFVVENRAGCPVGSVSVLSQVVYDTRFFWGMLLLFFGLFSGLGGVHYLPKTIFISTTSATTTICTTFLFANVTKLQNNPTSNLVLVAVLLSMLVGLLVALLMRINVCRRGQLAALGLICGLCLFNSFAFLLPNFTIYCTLLALTPLGTCLLSLYIQDKYPDTPDTGSQIKKIALSMKSKKEA